MPHKRKLFFVLLFLISFNTQIPNGQVEEVNKVLLSKHKVRGEQDSIIPTKPALIPHKGVKRNRIQERVAAFLQQAKIYY